MSILEIRYVEEKPDAKKWLELRAIVGLYGHDRPLEIAKKGLENSLYVVCVYNGEELIGMARVIGDGYTCFYIQDVLVNPEYQGRGIGKEIMKRILNYLKDVDKTAIIGLMSSKGKESFYEKFGFIRRPNEDYGPGMIKLHNR